MLPEAFLDRMQQMLGEEYGEFLASFEQERYQALRVNALKAGDARPSLHRFRGRKTAIIMNQSCSPENIPTTMRVSTIFRSRAL